MTTPTNLGVTEPSSPNRKLAMQSVARGLDTVLLEEVFLDDGMDVTQGAVADAVVAAGAAGSVSAKLRRLTTDLATLLTQTDGIETLLTAIDGHVDGIEGLLTTLNGLVDGLEAQGAAAIPAGTNNIGDVDVLTVPADPFGVNADAAVAAGAAGSLSAKLRRLSADLGTMLGYVDGIETLLAGGLPVALGAGGGLKVDGSGTALPVSGTVSATVAGTVAVSNLPVTQPVSGTVAVSNLPATQPVSNAAAAQADGHSVTIGALADAAVAAGATGSIGAKLRAISRDLVANIVLAAGANRIGKVTIRNAADGADIDPLSGATFSTAVGAVADASVSNPASSASVIAAIKGVLTLLTAALTMVGNVAHAATDSGNPVKTGGKYNSTPPILTTGQRGDTQLDGGANALVSLATLIAGEDLTNDVQKVEQRFSYSHIATATTTVVKSGAGFLHTVTVNTTAAGIITIYDNTAGSGTVIAILKASVLEGSFRFDVQFATGLSIVTAGASDITVSYR